ncbi:MAG: hypothetical protein LBI02_00435 [Opitutaceae bacterium]|jgi:hypothetical protein|nr:hypothetical protein [Opitutaceae bacterium]
MPDAPAGQGGSSSALFLVISIVLVLVIFLVFFIFFFPRSRSLSSFSFSFFFFLIFPLFSYLASFFLLLRAVPLRVKENDKDKENDKEEKTRTRTIKKITRSEEQRKHLPRLAFAFEMPPFHGGFMADSWRIHGDCRLPGIGKHRIHALYCHPALFRRAANSLTLPGPAARTRARRDSMPACFPAWPQSSAQSPKTTLATAPSRRPRGFASGGPCIPAQILLLRKRARSLFLASTT